MKKVLLGTSALALAAAYTSSANAAEWDIKLGGYMEQHIAYTDFDAAPGTDFTGVHQASDQEFYVRPEITLDNGIKIQARMDFEGAANGGVDEPHLRISGSFGSLRIGEDDLASADTIFTAPDVTFLGINSGSQVAFQPGEGIFGTDNNTMTRTTLPAVEADPAGITYFTPRFFGIQIGASYARDDFGSENDDLIDLNDDAATDNQLGNIVAVGGTYVNSFGDFDVAVGGGWSRGEVAGSKRIGRLRLWCKLRFRWCDHRWFLG